MGYGASAYRASSYTPHGPVLLDETFASGYDFSWSDGETVGTNCVVDQAADPADVGSPPSYLGGCLQCNVVAAGTEAYVQHDFDKVHNTTYVRFEETIDVEGLADLGTCAIGFAANNDLNPLWQLVLQQVAGALQYTLQMFHDGTSNNIVYTGVETGKRRRHEIKWDSWANTYEWRVDGVSQESGSLTGDATGWGLRYLRMGMYAASAQGTSIYYDNIQIRKDGWPGPSAETYSTSGTRVWTERFEATGTDETWSDGEIVEAGNSVDDDVATSSVTGAPARWGSQCFGVTVASTNPGALIRHQFGTGMAVVYLRDEVIITTDAMGSTTTGTLWAIKKTQVPDVSAVAAFVTEAGATRIFSVSIDIAGDGLSHGLVPDVQLNRCYVIEFKYDATAGYWCAYVDGVLVQSGHIKSTYAATLETIVCGTSASSTAQDWSAHHDNYLISELGFPTLP